MAETLGAVCERFASEMDVDIAVYDGNGIAQYVTGTRELTDGDVTTIQNVLNVNSVLPFTLRLKDTNYFCLKTSDGNLIAKGGFNCQSNFGCNSFNKKKSKADIGHSLSNFKKCTNETLFSNSDRRIAPSEQDNKTHSNEHKLVQGFVNKGFVENELYDKEFLQGTKNVRNDSVIHGNDKMRQLERPNNNNNNNNHAPNDNTAVKTAQIGVKIHKEHGQKNMSTSLLVQHEHVSDCMIATTIQTYLVVLRGFHDGQESWIKMIPQLNEAFESLSHEE